MTKQELMENYTMEQLADKIIALNITINDMKNTENIIKQYNSKQCDCEKLEKRTPFTDKELAEKWKKLAEELNEKGYKAIEENEKLKAELHRRENTISQIDDILKELFGVTFEICETEEDFEGFKKCLEKNIKTNTITDFLPSEPVCIAGMLINLQIECENNPLSKMVTKEETYMRKMFDISELRQIAEHLLVYCNANGEEK